MVEDGTKFEGEDEPNQIENVQSEYGEADIKSRINELLAERDIAYGEKTQINAEIRGIRDRLGNRPDHKGEIVALNHQIAQIERRGLEINREIAELCRKQGIDDERIRQILKAGAI